MTREEVHDLMENELRCVQRGNYCDRDCGYMPKAGQMVRYNCPFYKAKFEPQESEVDNGNDK